MSVLCQQQKSVGLFDHPVSPREKREWKIESNCFRGFKADDKFKSARPLDRQVARTRTSQNFVYRSDRSLEQLSIYWSVTQKGMGRREACPISIDDCGQAFVQGKLRHDWSRFQGKKRGQQ
jgi:hypothetical protein